MSAVSDLAKALLGAVGENDDNQGVKHYIDTGIPLLNQVISGRTDGGLPQGRLIEMFAPSSAGKCQPEDTMVLSEHGLTSFGELFRIEGFEPFCVQKDVEHKVQMVNERGELESTSHLVWSGKRKTFKLKTRSGMSTEATYKHPLRVMDANGRIVWRKAGEVKVGDYLVAARGTNRFGKGLLTTNEAKLLGYLIADGAMGYEGRVSLSNSDPEVISEYKRVMNDIFGVTPVTREKGGESLTQDHFVNSKALRETIERRYGVPIVKSSGKTVPACVRMAGEAAQIEFIRSYFELECHIDRGRGSIEVVSASEKLLADVQLMLLNLGIVSTINPKTVKGYEENNYWRLTIGPAEAALYFEVIGFDTKARNDVVNSVRELPRRNSSIDTIPNQTAYLRGLFDSCDTSEDSDRVFSNYVTGKNGLGYSALLKIVEHSVEISNGCQFAQEVIDHLQRLHRANYFYDPVVSISTDEKPVFDVSLPVTHSFIANGFISHNTALATHFMKQAQQAGGIAGFHDHEKTFDLRLAKNVGLSDKFPFWIYKQPTTWEKSNTNIVKAAMVIRKSGAIPPTAPILFVLDSIASCNTESTVGKSLEDLNMNDTTALARVTSTTLKSMAAYAEEFNFTVLYLNQVRTKIGVMFGDPTTTPGGGSMEFYATTRFALSRSKIMAEVKGGKEFVGQTITMKTVKNKLTRPFQEFKLDMMFEADGVAYFDVTGALLDSAVALGRIEKSGAFFVWTDGKKHYRKALIKMINDSGLESELRTLATP